MNQAAASNRPLRLSTGYSTCASPYPLESPAIDIWLQENSYPGPWMVFVRRDAEAFAVIGESSGEDDMTTARSRAVEVDLVAA